jgi:hypothetical protein
MWGDFDPFTMGGIHSPNQLANGQAWYDLNDVSSLRNNAGTIPTTGQSIKLVSDKSGNSAVNVLCLNGVAANKASTTDSAAISVTGPLQLDFVGASASWTGTNQGFANKLTNAGQFSWDWAQITTGALRFRYSTDGTALKTANSTASHTFAAFQTGYFRVTLNTATGDVMFYTSPDGVTYTQLGTTVALASGAIFDGTDPVEVGLAGAGSQPFNGNINRFTIRNGIGGPIVYDPQFATFSKLAATGTESSSNAATVTINTSGATGARISGARDLYHGTAENQPVYLPWSGSNYGYLPGLASNGYSTPDSAAVSVTGPITIDYYGTVENGATNPALVFKDNTTVSSYRLRWINGGFLRFTYSVDGSTLIDKSSTATVPATGTTPVWMRATRDSVSGDTKFYTGGSAETPVWVQLGTTVSGAAGAIFDSAIALSVGVASEGVAVPLNGSVYRARVYNGFDGAGTLAFDFNPSAYVSGTTFLDSSSNAATITLNGGATVITKTSLTFDGSNDYLKAASFSLAQPTTVYFVGSQVTWTNGDNIVDGGTASAAIFQNGSTPNIGINAGSTIGNITTLALGTNGIITAVFNGASSAYRLNRATAGTGNAGANNPNGFTVGSNTAGAGAFGNITASEILIYSVAHAEVTQNRLLRYLMAKWRIT